MVIPSYEAFSTFLVTAFVIALTAIADTFSPAGVLSGSAMDRDDCRWPETSVWVEVDGQGECIRYFHSGVETSNELVHVWFHGDRIWRNSGENGEIIERRVINYQKRRPDALQAFADRVHTGHGIPYIRFSRPGVYGSTGDHKQRRRPREVKVVEAALDALKEKYSIRRFALSGQSGGGHLVASLLARRNDITCAIITSGLVAVRERIKNRGWSSDATGYGDYHDPIDYLSDIPKNPNRRVFMIGDPQDQIVPFATQALFHESLLSAGHHSSLLTVRADGVAHHRLDQIGFRVVRWCVGGLEDDEIAQRASMWRQ